jgi:hypothetical protein
MPQGVNLDRATGNVSGTPTAAGSFGVTVSDAKGASKEQGLQISVGQAAAPPPPSPPPAQPPAADHASTIESSERGRRNAFLEPAESWQVFEGLPQPLRTAIVDKLAMKTARLDAMVRQARFLGAE